MAEAAERLTAVEFTYWGEYLSRWHGQDDDRRAGVIASTVANANGGKKRGGTFGPDDFFPRLRSAPKAQGVHESLQQWERLAARPEDPPSG